MPVAPLSHSDQRLLRAILERGHALERAWPAAAPAQVEAPHEAQLAALGELRAMIARAGDANSESLSRLAFHVRDLTPEMSARHLSAVLVPFERLLSRALRDDEFLVTDTDGHRASHRSHTEGGASHTRERGPLVVIADCLRSAFNVGAILRTAEALGAERAILTGYTPTPENEKTARTSMGTHEVLPWESARKAEDAIERLQRDAAGSSRSI